MKQQRRCFDIHYQGIPQSELRVPGKNHWKFPENNLDGAVIFNMIHTAKEFGMTPYQFFALPSDEKAMMMVYSNVVSKMKAASSHDGRRLPKAKK